MEKRYIFDADTHVSPYCNFDKSINACQWEERMERAGVAHAIVWAAAAGSGGCDGEQPVYRKGGTEKQENGFPLAGPIYGKGLKKPGKTPGYAWRSMGARA